MNDKCNLIIELKLLELDTNAMASRSLHCVHVPIKGRDIYKGHVPPALPPPPMPSYSFIQDVDHCKYKFHDVQEMLLLLSQIAQEAASSSEHENTQTFLGPDPLVVPPSPLQALAAF